MGLLYIMTFLALLGSSMSAEESARMLSSKTILNKMIVQNKDLTMEYVLYNVGTRSVFAPFSTRKKENKVEFDCKTCGITLKSCTSF